MQTQLNKDEYEMKERQWKKAFRMAQLKYVALKEESREWEKEVHEREADVLFYKDRALVDESEILLLREQISDLQCRIIDGHSVDGDDMINVQDEEKANEIQVETEKANQLLLLENQIDSLD
eukprot:scaffold744_cov170-Chaetoceros_neogracile.AAC.7